MKARSTIARRAGFAALSVATLGAAFAPSVASAATPTPTGIYAVGVVTCPRLYPFLQGAAGKLRCFSDTGSTATSSENWVSTGLPTSSNVPSLITPVVGPTTGQETVWVVTGDSSIFNTPAL